MDSDWLLYQEEMCSFLRRIQKETQACGKAVISNTTRAVEQRAHWLKKKDELQQEVTAARNSLQTVVLKHWRGCVGEATSQSGQDVPPEILRYLPMKLCCNSEVRSVLAAFVADGRPIAIQIHIQWRYGATGESFMDEPVDTRGAFKVLRDFIRETPNAKSRVVFQNSDPKRARFLLKVSIPLSKRPQN